MPPGCMEQMARAYTPRFQVLRIFVARGGEMEEG